MNLIGMNRKHVELLVFALFISAGAIGVARSILTQDVVWVANGLGWDGVHYDRLLKYFAGDGRFSERAVFPFCGRIGTPWLLATIFDGRVSFYRFNIAVSAAFSILFVVTTFSLWRGSIKALTAALAIPSFLIFSPIKFTNFYPVYMDPPFMLLLTVALFFLLKGRYNYAAVMCLLALPFREAALYLIPLLGAFAVIEARQRIGSAVFGIVVLAIGFGVKALMLQVSSCEPQSQVMTAFWWFYRLLTDPNRVLVALAAISLTLGPLLLLQKDRALQADISEERIQRFSLVAIVYVGLLSIVGGSDVTRIFYTFIPLYAPILIIAFRKLDLSGFALACFGWVITNQMLNHYEQPIADKPSNDLTGYFAQFPDVAHPVVALTLLVIWLILWVSHSFFLTVEKRIFDRATASRVPRTSSMPFQSERL